MNSFEIMFFGRMQFFSRVDDRSEDSYVGRDDCWFFVKAKIWFFAVDFWFPLRLWFDSLITLASVVVKYGSAAFQPNSQIKCSFDGTFAIITICRM